MQAEDLRVGSALIVLEEHQHYKDCTCNKHWRRAKIEAQGWFGFGEADSKATGGTGATGGAGEGKSSSSPFSDAGEEEEEEDEAAEAMRLLGMDGDGGGGVWDGLGKPGDTIPGWTLVMTDTVARGKGLYNIYTYIRDRTEHFRNDIANLGKDATYHVTSRRGLDPGGGVGAMAVT